MLEVILVITWLVFGLGMLSAVAHWASLAQYSQTRIHDAEIRRLKRELNTLNSVEVCDGLCNNEADEARG